MSLPIIYKRTVPLSRVHKNEGDTIVYADDFGDSWRHEVLLEAILPVHADRTYPLCVAGARARPPEDVGGVGAMLPFSKRYAIQCMQNTTSC